MPSLATVGRFQIVTAVVVILAAATEPATAADSGLALPTPTGKAAIGRVTYFWTDDTRPEPNTPDEHDKRELRVDLWYPAEATADAKAAPYFPDLTALDKPIGPEAILLAPIRGHTLASPPIAHGDTRYPTLLLSPGMGTNALQYTAIVEELVSHGYVVATVDHPFQSKAILYPDGRVVVIARDRPEDLAGRVDPEKALQDYRGKVEPRSADLRFVLDQLQRLDAGQSASDVDRKFSGRLDLKRVGVLGHSIGGVAAAEACLDDSRFKAAVNMDGHARSLPFLADSDGNGPRQPLLELTDMRRLPTDQELVRLKTSREEYEQQMAAMTKRVDDAMRTIAGSSFRVAIPGVRHQSFSDMAMWDPAKLDERYRRIQIMRDYIRAFFDKTLLDKDQTLFEAESSPYPDVTVERFVPSK